MKTKIFTLLFCFLLIFAGAKSQMILKSIPESGHPGIQILIMEDGTSYFKRHLIDVIWDNTTSIISEVILKNDDIISLRIPQNASIGFHTIKIIMDDNFEGVVPFEVTTKPETGDDQIDGTDPDPDTQRGDPIWAGKNPQPIKPGTPVYNPSGGYPEGHNIPCDMLHMIDGVMTDSVYQDKKEWSGIYPLPGRFSYLYLDYCDVTKTMYVLNDWFNGTGRYDSNSCYNRFEFKTGGGLEQWELRVFHSYNKPVEVFRNGINVSDDTNFVIAGRYGYEETILVDSAHTIYEFGIKVISGVFFMPVQHDPYSPPEGPTILVVCDDDGYGLVPEPTILTGVIGSSGVTSSRNDRYIPIQGVAGLVLEPFSFSGDLWSNSSTIRITGENTVTNYCSGNHIIDGLFSEGEWINSQPAQGTYSNLYADYCDGILYILNDWFLATEEPDEMNCYNLFELYTGNASEHWGIYVYHDINKGIKVFRNGEDVSNDSNIVIGGKFNFDKSPLVDTPHTIYEFGIRASEGNWHLFMCDPGPASFCDTDKRPAPRRINTKTGIRKDINDPSGTHDDIINVDSVQNIELIIGTTDITSDWFSRKFEAYIQTSEGLFEIEDIYLPNSALISDDLDLTYEKLSDALYKVTGISKSNFQNSGDLFAINATVSKNLGGINKELKVNLELSNRTTVMRTIEIPKVQFNIISDVLDFNQNIKLIDNLHLYPNPNLNSPVTTLQFSLKNDASITFELIDIKGNRQIIAESFTYTSGRNQVQINTENLISGSYFLRLKTDGYSRVIQFEVIR